MELEYLLRLDRLEAAREIENLMGRYVFFRMYGMLKEASALFSRADDAMLEMPMGIYEGPDAAERAIVTDHTPPDPDMSNGTLIMHNICTPVIEVAGDGRTGKGVWISPGMATVGPPGEKKEMRCWLKYGCDFIRENGCWKIWHMHKYSILDLPYFESWTDPRWAQDKLPAPPAGNSDKPLERAHRYLADAPVDRAPLPPEKYYSFD